MCGRYRLSRRKQIIEEHFDKVPDDQDWTPRYNIAPTQPIPVIRQNPKEPVRELSLMRWGLIPSWAKDASGSAGMINARSETAATKPAFRDRLKSRRCLIPTDGFYEWKRDGNAKQPYCFEVNEGELFAFAGLWDGWKDSNGCGGHDGARYIHRNSAPRPEPGQHGALLNVVVKYYAESADVYNRQRVPIIRRGHLSGQRRTVVLARR